MEERTTWENIKRVFKINCTICMGDLIFYLTKTLAGIFLLVQTWHEILYRSIWGQQINTNFFYRFSLFIILIL
jgi:hypothetical protein